LAKVSFAGGPQWRVWNTSNSNIPTNSIWSIYIDANNVKWIGTSQGLVKFNDINFVIYDILNSPMKGNIVFSIAEDKLNNLWLTAFKQGGEGALMKFDKVNNWSYFNTQNSPIENGNQRCLAIDSGNTVWSKLFFLNKYNGTNWVKYDTSNSPMNGTSWDIFIDSKNNKWITIEGGGIFRLQDTTWTIFNRQNSGMVSNFTVKSKEDSHGNIWTTSYGGGLNKYNLDSNKWNGWTPQNSNLPTSHLWGLHIDKNDVKWIGGFYSNINGLVAFNDTTFTIYPFTVTNFYEDIRDIKEDKYGNLWLSTTGGLMQFNKTEIVGIENNNTIVNNFQLHQNYPNPFNPATTISYSIKKSSFIELKIFDVNGKLIKIIESGFKPAGNYDVSFDSNGLPSGIYFYTLIAENNFSETKKMILVK